MTIGQRIKSERTKLNLSQEQVAKYIGSTKQAIYKYENEIVTNIPTDKIYMLAEVLGTTPAYLMGWEETESENKNPPTISEGEQMLLDLFRQIPDDRQRLVLDMIRAALNIQK